MLRVHDLEEGMIQNQLIKRKLKVLVENKVSFSAEGSELSIYDTFQKAERVKLKSDQLMFCGMVSGKKVMHIDDAEIHDPFLPHESFVMAPNQEVEIDFPNAQFDKPTTCLAIEIAPERIQKVEHLLSHQSPISKDYGEWRYRDSILHSHHTTETQSLLHRIVQIYTENHPDRSFMIDLAVTELSARLLRHQTREFIVAHTETDPELNGLQAAINFILKNLSKPLDIEKLMRIACMGRTKFFTVFKQHLGCSPIVFQQQERLKKAAKLLSSGHQVTQTCFSVGFLNTSHFSRVFKQFFGMTPRQYQLKQ